MKTYKITCYKGAVGDFGTEWWTKEDWDKHKLLVEKLKKEGTYLEPFEVEVSVMPNHYNDR